MNSLALHGTSGRLIGAIGTTIVFAERPDAIRAAAQEACFLSYTLKRESGNSTLLELWLQERLRRDEELREHAKKNGLVALREHNAYVNTGLNNAGDREFNLGGLPVAYIGVSSNTAAVTPSTIYGNGPSAGTNANTIIKPLSPAPTRTGQIVTGGATFTNADFPSGVFIQNKLFFIATSTDAGTALIDVVGGTGGTAPYNRTFSLDLTNAGSFTETAQLAVQYLAQ